MKDRDLEDRIFNFAVRVIKFLKTLKHSKENDVIRYQLAKAATSVGANYEEAQGAFSRDDFKYKIGICFKEAKESNYWLRIIKAAGLSEGDDLEYLINESFELKSIFGSILKKIHHRKDMKQKE
ncbi:MAG: four helix bundle protein [bacterium]|nr:four helix bundle protein [bacterium]